MQWVRDIALFLVFTGILLELIADTKYYKFARWVAGVVLLLQFIKPVTNAEDLWNRFLSGFASFDYALGCDQVLEKIYETENQTENSVLLSYKKKIEEQISYLLKKNGLQLLQSEITVAKDGTLQELFVLAVYADKPDSKEIVISPIAQVKIDDVPKPKQVSPLELYIRELLAEFYRMDENSVSVVIQEAE